MSSNPLSFQDGWTLIYEDELNHHKWGWYRSLASQSYTVYHECVNEVPGFLIDTSDKDYFEISWEDMTLEPAKMMDLLIGWMHQICEVRPCQKMISSKL